jgi:hypothetical protein
MSRRRNRASGGEGAASLPDLAGLPDELAVPLTELGHCTEPELAENASWFY